MMSDRDDNARLVLIEEQVKSLCTSVEFIKNALIGEINDKPGLIVRLDRVEQKLALRDRVGWALISAVLTSVVAQLWTFMH